MALLGRDTSVTGPFPKGVLLLETLKGREALGVPYVFELGLLSKEPNLDPDDVLGMPLAVGLKLNTGEERFFHGIVTEFCKTGTSRVHKRYGAKLSPYRPAFPSNHWHPSIGHPSTGQLHAHVDLNDRATRVREHTLKFLN